MLQQLTGRFVPLGTREVVRKANGEIVVGGVAPGPGDFLSTACDDGSGVLTNPDGTDKVPRDQCNSILDTKAKDFADLKRTDVVGGNKFISTSVEYRFPISPTLGLMGVAFFDVGNSFAEGENLFDVTAWRYGTGAGIQWFSPFGPLAIVLGWPLNPLSVEDSPVFEFSVGGVGF